MSDRTPIFAQHETWEDIVAGLRAELERLKKAPIHLGYFYNYDVGITEIYILDDDGNETDRTVKAGCLLKRISEYFKEAKQAEAELAAERDLNNRLRTTMESERAKFEAHDAEHLASHLCLLKHGPDEKPENNNYVLVSRNDGQIFVGYWDGIQRGFNILGGYYLSYTQIAGWYSLPEGSEG